MSRLRGDDWMGGVNTAATRDGCAAENIRRDGRLRTIWEIRIRRFGVPDRTKVYTRSNRVDKRKIVGALVEADGVVAGERYELDSLAQIPYITNDVQHQEELS